MFTGARPGLRGLMHNCRAHGSASANDSPQTGCEAPVAWAAPGRSDGLGGERLESLDHLSNDSVRGRRAGRQTDRDDPVGW